MRSPCSFIPASDFTVQLESTCLTYTVRDIWDEGTAVEWEEQLKLSEIRLKPIVINNLDLKDKVSNLSPCRTSITQSNSTLSLQSHSVPTPTVYNTMNSRNELQRCSSLISEIPESDFHFDFEECNICMKSKYFDVIPVQLHARNGFHCVNSEH